ncbi:MAG: winged helix-turn-helix transcriptional regulator [Candidatus Eremiobacteraeota bacterium]|nr:winged helix-turn-helix transcriptional regulator [Candidatus Eremiobacteraeota bacterium]MBC5826787.1 winged helix-turn-helix transcriptional regulator [Candidatus Eremiobacteraeota bacterium]
MVNNQTHLDAVFSALADPTRRAILERLAKRRLTVGEIAGGFPISQPAISKHVKILEEAGLLNREVVGRVHRCMLDPKAMSAATSWMDRQRRYWNAALDRLSDYLEKSNSEDTTTRGARRNDD